MTTFLFSIMEEIPWATIYSTSECNSSCTRFLSTAAWTTAFAIEWGKCSSKHAAILNNSLHFIPLNETISRTVGSAFVKVPVLSKTIVSASAIASKYLPPLTTIWWSFASLIADKTEIGIASFNAHEKSTISTDTAFVTFLVNKYVRAVPANV